MYRVLQVIVFPEVAAINGRRSGQEHMVLIKHPPNIYISQDEWALRRWLLRDTPTAEEFAKKQADFILKSGLLAQSVIVGELATS